MKFSVTCGWFRSLCISLCSSAGMCSAPKYWYVYWTTQRNKKTWGSLEQETQILPVEKWNPVSVLFDAWGLRQAVYLHSGIWEDFGFSEASPAPWGRFPISAYWNRWRLFHACLSNIRNHYKGSWREEHWCVYSWFIELFYIQASVVICVVQCQQSVLISSVWDLGHQTQRRGSSVPTQLCVGFCLEIWTTFNCQLGKVTCFIPEK